MTLDEFIELYGYTWDNVYSDWVRIRSQTIELLRKFDNNRFNLVRKGRQIGFTTALQLYSLYLAIKDDQRKNIVYYANNSGATQRFITNITSLLSRVTENHMSGLSRNRIRFRNNTTIKGICNIHNLRGSVDMIDVIMFDEYAYLVDNIELIPTVSTHINIDSKMIIGSTPNGQDMFYSLWVNNRMGFEKSHICTTDIEEFSSRGWIEDQRRYYNNNDKRYDTEVLGAFVDMDGIWLIGEQNNGIRIKYNIKKHKLNGIR
jgi:hypothetical protein